MNSYLEIYNETKQRILKGDLPPGAKLPAHRDMSENYAVSIATVTRAINRLKHEGLVNSYRGLGTLVAKVPSTAVEPATRTICFISPYQQFMNEAFSFAVQEVFAGTTWSLNTRSTHSNLEWYAKYLTDCHDNPPAGMIWLTMSPMIFTHTPAMLPRPCTKVVLIAHEVPGRTYDLVRTNALANGTMLAEYLVNKGYRDFVFVTEAPRDELLTSRCLEGLRKGFADHGVAFGMEHTWSFRNPHSYGLRIDPVIDSYTFMKHQLARHRPRVIIAGHDWIGVGAIRAILDLGLKIPDDVAVVSTETTVDLSSITSTPRLTAIDTLFYFRARLAAEILKRRLEGDEGPIVYHEIHGRMREGETA
jgi:DNA-binding LacI/PurR family transcriptional regulator